MSSYPLHPYSEHKWKGTFSSTPHPILCKAFGQYVSYYAVAYYSVDFYTGNWILLPSESAELSCVLVCEKCQFDICWRAHFGMLSHSGFLRIRDNFLTPFKLLEYFVCTFVRAFVEFQLSHVSNGSAAIKRVSS